MTRVFDSGVRRMFTAVMSFGMLCLVVTSGLMYVETMEELFDNGSTAAARDRT